MKQKIWSLFRALASLIAPSQPLRRRQLLVDVSVIYAHDARTGVQRVVRAVWTHLRATVSADIDVIPIAASRRKAYRIVPENFLDRPDRPPLSALPKVSPRMPGDVFFGLDLSAHIVPRRARELLRWRKQGCRLTFVVYDLLAFDHPHWFSDKLTRNFGRWLRFVGLYADQALCISHTVANNLRNWILEHVGPARSISIATIRLGGDICASAPSAGLAEAEELMLAKGFNGPILLCIATIEPRKGHAPLLDAFDVIANRRPDVHLLFVGKPGWKTGLLQCRMKELAARSRNFFWFSEASDEFLTQLYERSSLVIVPSFDEGFGLPILEALQHRRPVLARDIPVFRELDAPGVHYFSEAGPARLADDILAVANMVGPPLPPLVSASWKECAANITECLGVVDRGYP